MPYRSKRKATSVAAKAAELAVAVPQVVAHRITRMALSGPTLSERDRKEFELMVAEKKSAFAEAWQAMAAQSFRANQALATSMFRSIWSPSLGRKPGGAKVAAQIQSAAIGVFAKGLAPVHRKAVANAKRLARTKLR
jgi:hypothetical protein